MDNRLLRFARLALAVAQRVVPDRASKFAPRRYQQPQLLACLLVKEHLGLDYRTTREVLSASDGLRSSLGLTPDHATLWWYTCHRVGPDLIRAALAETVGRIEPKPEPRQVALDSTGLWLSYSSWSFAWRAKRDRVFSDTEVDGPYCLTRRCSRRLAVASAVRSRCLIHDRRDLPARHGGREAAPAEVRRRGPVQQRHG